jgi:deazaflavin-dependent oxidoreductase (nitroreductase family)
MTSDQKAYNAQMIAEFRATRDHPEGPFPGRPLLLLTTTGAKTGLARTTPLMYATIDGRLLLIGSNMGAEVQPDWCHNLIANPQVTIEVSKEIYAAQARVTTGAERIQLWDALIAQSPFFIEHQTKTTREIPLVVIERQGSSARPQEDATLS